MLLVVFPVVLPCLSAQSKSFYDVDKWNACVKSQSLNDNGGFYGPSDLRKHIYWVLLGPQHLKMT